MWHILVYWTRQLTFCVRLVTSRPAVMSQDQSWMFLMCGLRTEPEHKYSFQSCLTLGSPMDCTLPGSSVHGILQARILEWVAMPFSRGASQTRDHTQVSHIAGRFSSIWASRKTLSQRGLWPLRWAQGWPLCSLYFMLVEWLQLFLLSWLVSASGFLFAMFHHGGCFSLPSSPTSGNQPQYTRTRRL